MNDQVLQCEIKLNDEIDMELTKDDKICYSDVWCIHCERAVSLNKRRGKTHSLLLGQFTLVLIDKMRQGVDWMKISESCNPISLFKHTKKSILVGDILEDYGDTSISSKMSCTHLEACKNDPMKSHQSTLSGNDMSLWR